MIAAAQAHAAASKRPRARSRLQATAGRWINARALAAFAMAAASLPARAELEVVTTTADLAALVQAVGGDRVKVNALAKPTEDPHFVDPKPSYIVRLNRADLLVDGGAELEEAWLQPLLQGARNSKLLAGGDARVQVAKGIELLDVPTSLDRARGDIHAAGNPHFLMDPFRARQAAQTIAQALVRIDATSAGYYQANFDRFAARLDERLGEWQKRLEPHRGRRLAAYHNIWPYFGQRFGLRIDLFLEPKPGIPPTPASLSEVVGEMTRDRVRLILVEPFQPRRVAERLAAKTNAEVIDLTQYPGGLPGTEGGYLELMEFLVDRLGTALDRTR